MTNHAYITRLASFLPLEPVSNDEMEAVLGQVGSKPSRARRTVLRSNGIRSRHYAIDRATGQRSMSNAQLAAAAITALEYSGVPDILAVATSKPDTLGTPHGYQVQDQLQWGPLELADFSGICCSGVAALKYGWLNVLHGNAKRAVVVASELASRFMRAENFEPEIDAQVAELKVRPEIAFEKDFLRWMLSDGAGALVIERVPVAPLSLRILWISTSSAAGELPACMYAGAIKNPDGSLKSWMSMNEDDWRKTSVFSAKQDVRLLDKYVVQKTLTEPLQELIDRYDLKPSDIDWFLPHMSSKYFEQPIADAMTSVGMSVPKERWFTNLVTKGNTGSASPFIMLDELMRSGRINSGQRLLLFVPESGRFSNGFIYLEAVGTTEK